MKTKQTSVRVHTRKIDRSVARHKMKAGGIVWACKKRGDGSSFFADNWRDSLYL